MFLRMSIATRFAFVFLFAVALITGAFYLILDRIHLNQLKSQAETVADQLRDAERAGHDPAAVVEALARGIEEPAGAAAFREQVTAALAARNGRRR